MPEYLTKEEIKEWRSSLEKITLEEFAARRGKILEEQKHTNDLIDIVMNGQPVVTKIESVSEQVNSVSPVKKNVEVKRPAETEIKVSKQETKQESKKNNKQIEEPKIQKTVPESVVDFLGVEFVKPLTEREQKVFEMFYKHAGKIVYAKDLAELLSLPRDYVYKYIKTLRAKIKGDKLENADKGGYLLRL